MQFEDKPHSAVADSKNIARLFLKLLPEAKRGNSVAPTFEEKRLAVLDELAAQAQELNLGYEEK
jgi:inhibitor of KinA sporulation pathway (predicted exonuclease)